MTEDKIRKLEYRSIEFTQSEQQQKRDLDWKTKTKNRDSETSGEITKDSVFISLKTQKDWRKRMNKE